MGDAGTRGRLAVEYVLPLRWSEDSGLDELTAYLAELSGWAEVTVVDGSPAEVYRRHADRWAGLVRLVKPEPRPGRNGKVAGVVTGVQQARHEQVVIADDDVRYDRAGLAAVSAQLSGADLVRPQNYFCPLPWHARWDSGRTLLNRALGADHPGTFALRRSTFLAMGGYHGDVLFENLELCRTVRAHGGRELRAPSIFVARRPPSTRHFIGQRVRQAYDDLAQPARLVTEAAVAPAVLWLAAAARTSGRPERFLRLLGGGMVLVVGLAEIGRRRHGGRAVFPATSALWAPLWLTERGVCVWIALACRVRGGVPYAGERLETAAHSVRWLRRSAAARTTSQGRRGAAREPRLSPATTSRTPPRATIAPITNHVGSPVMKLPGIRLRP